MAVAISFLGGRPAMISAATGAVALVIAPVMRDHGYADDPDRVVIDLADAHIWDASTVASLYATTTKYARKGKTVTIVGLNQASAERHGRLSGELPSP